MKEIYRWRIASEINREFARFEMLVNDVAVMIVGFSDDGSFEVEFFEAISGRSFEINELHTLLLEGKTLAEGDR